MKTYNNHKYNKPNIRAPKNIKQTLTDLKGERDNNNNNGSSPGFPC